MPEFGFKVCVAGIDAVSEACEQNLVLTDCAFAGQVLSFPHPFSPSQILQLGEAITSLTGVSGDFGTDENRREPASCLFVDRLDRDWVDAAALLELSLAELVQARWIAACMLDEGETPAWATVDRTSLVRRFLEFCRTATETETDLVMVWEF